MLASHCVAERRSPPGQSPVLLQIATTMSWAVIFSSQRTDTDQAGYASAATRMLDLAAQQPGYLGVEDARDDTGFGITISYWEDLKSIGRWREQAEHLIVQQLGRERWYKSYRLRVCRVERESRFDQIAGNEQV